MVYQFVDKESSLLYSLEASDFQRPSARIGASEKPLSAAWQAAPIRKLWPLYLLISRPQKLEQLLSSALNWPTGIGLVSLWQKSGPAWAPLSLQNSTKAWTGHNGKYIKYIKWRMGGIALKVGYCYFNHTNTTLLCEKTQIAVLNYRTSWSRALSR